MLRLLTKLSLLIFGMIIAIQPISLNADSHTPNMNFNFLPKFVHYQGSVFVNGKSLSELETGIDFIEVKFINQKQIVKVDGKQVEVDEGQFVLYAGTLLLIAIENI